MTSTAASPILNQPLQAIRWHKVVDLGYASESAAIAAHERGVAVCSHCGTGTNAAGTNKSENLLQCSQCRVARYCSKEHQIADWKHGSHKLNCASLKRVGAHMDWSQQQQQPNSGINSAQAEARNELFGRIRFYACPYGVYRYATLGRGLLFVQSDRTLAVLSLAIPKDSCGRALGMRAVTIHFLTLGEFDQEVVRDDFELAAVRKDLQAAVAGYNTEREIPVLFRFRCGHVALGTAPLVPDVALCRSLGAQYFAESTAGCLQLNLDDC